MRVEVADHAADCVLEQDRIVDRFDIIPFDASNDLGQLSRLAQVVFGRRCLRAAREQAAAERQAQAHDRPDDDDQNCSGSQ